MLFYNRIDISEGTDLAESNNSRMYDLPRTVFNPGLKFQDYVCNGCHDLSLLTVNKSDIAIITVKNVDYCCIVHNIRKSEATNLLKNSVLEDRGYL